MKLADYLRVWLASIRYSVVRTLMFRFDFILWMTVDVAWMMVNLLLIEVIFGHINALAGWNKYQMLLLVGTSMIIGRLFSGLFMTNLFSVGRQVREGTFDFLLAQPGNPIFMLSTRKIDLDGFLNALLGAAVVIYSALKLHLTITVGGLLAYLSMLLIGLVIHYSAALLIVSLTFWIVKTEGIENTYFTFFEFSRLPRAAFHGLANIAFVYLLPVVIVSNLPAKTLLGGFDMSYVLWLAASAAVWFWLATFVFNRGLKRYTSASS